MSFCFVYMHIQNIYIYIHIYHIYIFFFSTGFLTQGLTLARQTLCHLNHSASPFFVLGSLFFLIVYSFIHMYIHCLGHLSPFLTSRQNLFCPLLQFCWRENIRDNKNDIAFLLVWDKDSYTERFLALLPCTSVLQPELVHHYKTSSLLPCHLPVVTSASLRLLYSLLYSEHINHFQVLGFLPFHYSSCTRSPLSVWPMSNNITAFVLGLKSTYKGEHNDFWSSEPG
jgi:hypothetical protein